MRCVASPCEDSDDQCVRFTYWNYRKLCCEGICEQGEDNETEREIAKAEMVLREYELLTTEDLEAFKELKATVCKQGMTPAAENWNKRHVALVQAWDDLSKNGSVRDIPVAGRRPNDSSGNRTNIFEAVGSPETVAADRSGKCEGSGRGAIPKNQGAEISRNGPPSARGGSQSEVSPRPSTGFPHQTANRRGPAAGIHPDAVASGHTPMQQEAEMGSPNAMDVEASFLMEAVESIANLEATASSIREKIMSEDACLTTRSA